MINKKLSEYLERYETDSFSRSHLERFASQLEKGIEHSNRCGYCNASLKVHKHTLTPMLVENLLKLRAKIDNKGENKVHISTEIELTKYQYNNFQKLRYFGLIAKHAEEGCWLLTRNGGDFCSGNIKMPIWVKTFRNKIQEKSNKLVLVGDILGREYLQKDFNSATVDRRSIEYWQD